MTRSQKSAGRAGWTTLMARDGHEFQAWLVPAQGEVRGAVVVLQEIFGVNAHIRAVAEDFAAQGYVAIAPALFDRVRRGIELGYAGEDMERARGTKAQIDPATAMKDIAASVAVVRHAGRVGVVGYCWGGLLAWLAARELPIACAVAYYGGGIASQLDKPPKKPVLHHYGERDKHIPLEDVERIRAADPKATIHIYPADHGFNCDQRASYDAPSARLARERTLEFLAQHVAGERDGGAADAEPSAKGAGGRSSSWDEEE